MALVLGKTQEKDTVCQSCQTTRIQYLHHHMFRQHTCSKWAQQHLVKASLVGATGPCGSLDPPKVCTARAPWQDRLSECLSERTLFHIENDLSTSHEVWGMANIRLCTEKCTPNPNYTACPLFHNGLCMPLAVSILLL